MTMSMAASHREGRRGIWAIGRVIIGLMQTDTAGVPSEIEWEAEARGGVSEGCAGLS